MSKLTPEQVERITRWSNALIAELSSDTGKAIKKAMDKSITEGLPELPTPPKDAIGELIWELESSISPDGAPFREIHTEGARQTMLKAADALRRMQFEVKLQSGERSYLKDAVIPALKDTIAAKDAEIADLGKRLVLCSEHHMRERIRLREALEKIDHYLEHCRSIARTALQQQE